MKINCINWFVREIPNQQFIKLIESGQELGQIIEKSKN